ncbi:MAG: PilZ domain-containing protein [Candidatus Omnitrophica bacterium]|jgi:c-di-GMP-binding flagellar brake protein YcgR|nr:PilZ domain-containing protein [Candidatus Omnitrophota bacterium]
MENSDLQHTGAERRRFSRLKIRLAIVYQVDKPLSVRMQVGEKEILATALDLSEGGLAISTNYDLPVGVILVIKFTLFRVEDDGKVNFYGPMEIQGEVRSNVVIPNDVRRLGICFLKIQDKDKQEISDFVKLALSR